MKVVRYKKYFAEEKAEEYHKKAVKALILFIFLTGSILLLIYLSIRYSSFFQKYWFFIFLLVVFGAIFLSRLRGLTDYYFSQRDISEKGIIGEERIEEVLINYPDDYILVFNYEIPEPRIGDIDALLISPKGIFILESKNYNGTFRLSGSDLYKKTRFRTYKLLIKDVVGQIKRQKEALERYLKNNGIEIPIYPFLVFTSNHSFVEQPSPQQKFSSIITNSFLMKYTNLKIYQIILQNSNKKY